MTSTAGSLHSTTTTSDAPSRTPLLAVLGFAASALLTAMGTFWDLTDNESGDSHSFSDYWPVLVMAAVTAAIVYGLVVRTAASGNPGRRSAVLGGVGFLSNAVFWAGLPAVIASAAVACALAQKDRDGSLSAGSKTGLGLAALTLAAAVVLAIGG
jgi:hypothetical protein